jgi:hypothetical protein
MDAENSPLPGFDLRTVEAVASRYTGYAIPAYNNNVNNNNNNNIKIIRMKLYLQQSTTFFGK